ncbi:hypothetical protein GE21DRAFT_4629 [Neurospora crassa]|uniref:Uncharacterized protein n=1 Tax=Neurospora crassa (strain ATCC 24698 / 74-OR23-1A / CBS 708.71 / DSM 1257 / FGSC 987) TaxID=367110 RepID=U9W379_NEUCR|nr:hypothetical protein NCU16677 [Neurospora crassa OR74A]ESA43336.1 hypothetical protein NCU16677 [Neurospora crassa OR74A]KHE89577.1 hypothetical protein GE21DRAFT_4629 [Neurospora crassa]|eukprot:XP_011394051.1 hypothetical protein NCU16677 [Neurospora crassa OR74A]
MALVFVHRDLRSSLLTHNGVPGWLSSQASKTGIRPTIKLCCSPFSPFRHPSHGPVPIWADRDSFGMQLHVWLPLAVARSPSRRSGNPKPPTSQLKSYACHSGGSLGTANRAIEGAPGDQVEENFVGPGTHAEAAKGTRTKGRNAPPWPHGMMRREAPGPGRRNSRSPHPVTARGGALASLSVPDVSLYLIGRCGVPSVLF